MDSATKKVHDILHEYLDDVQGRSHMPISEQLVGQMNDVLKSIRRGETELAEDLSPGQREAAEANTGLYMEQAIEPEDNLSPGERETRELSHGVN